MTDHQRPLHARVTEVVTRMGTARLSDLLKALPEVPRHQLKTALGNARDRKLLHVVVRGSYRANRESVWAPGPMTPQPKPLAVVAHFRSPFVSSAWDLGTPRFDVALTMPPGRVYQKLGPWIITEEREEGVLA